MNSLTSRPRSPISATTETSASVPRAIIDSRLDLPTPDPAKMPRRWPRPHGTAVSRARTPRASWSVDHLAAQRVRRRRVDADVLAVDDRRPVVDRPTQAVEHPAEQAGPTVTGSGRPAASTTSP